MVSVKRHALKVSIIPFILFFIILGIKDGFAFSGISEFVGYCFGIWVVAYLITAIVIVISRKIFKKKKGRF